MEDTDDLGRSLQTAAESNKKKLCKILSTGIDIEYPNSLGQTPLFCACAKNNYDAAVILLKHGANPNIAAVDGTTPLHVACYKGNIKLVCRMIDSGADLSLRNDVGDGVYEWAAKNAKPKKQKAMTDFLERVQYYGEILTCYDKDEAVQMKLPTRFKRQVSETSVMEMMRYKTGGVESSTSLRSNDSQDFGHVYPCPKESAGIVSVVPLIPEMMLRNVTNVSYECSLDFTMREMMWIRTPVNVKQLNSEFEVHERAILILNEAEKFGKLRHPNILLLMALCQAKTLDMMTLVFECAGRHNLYQVLHLDGTELKYEIQMKISCQLCYVLEFIHKQDLIHCSLSSKAVYLTSTFDVKLGNFEFMMESSEADKCKSSPLHSYPPATWLHSWMAPEVIMGGAPSFSSDVFSYSCIVWETFRGTVPWSWLSNTEHYKLIETEKNVALSVLLLPKSLYFLRESLKLEKEERQGDMSTIGFMLRPLESSFSFFDRKNKSYNAADDASDSPCIFQNVKHFRRQKNMKQDRLLFDASSVSKPETKSDGDAQSLDGDHCQGRSTYSLPREYCLTKQFLFSGACPAAGPRVHFQKSVQPASYMAQGLTNTTKSDKPSRPNVRLKTRHMTDKSHMDGCVSDVASLSVKELARHYQECLNQHKLRQAILRGSMTPHGSCPELDSQSSLSKWNSLPATLRDSSLDTDSNKTWTLGIDEMERNTSELGDLSSTPVLKSCSTPEEKDYPGNDTYRKPCVSEEKKMKCHSFQQRLRDVGVGCNEKGEDDVHIERQNILKDRMDVKRVRDPENLRRELVNEVKLFLSDVSQSQSHWVSPDSRQADIQTSKNVVRPVTDVKTSKDIFKDSQQEAAGTDTPQSDISWDLTQVTPMEAAELTENAKGNSQERLISQSLDQEIKQFTNVPQQLAKLSLSLHKSKEEKEALDVLNSTLNVEDETLKGENMLSADVDPISCWVDSKLEDIRRKVAEGGSGKLRAENEANSFIEYDEEISNEVSEDVYLHGDFHPLNMKTSELVQETGSSQNFPVCEFEFQEFYIDDDLNNGMKDHHESSEKKENLNNHVNGDDQPRTAVPLISPIKPGYDAITTNELPRGLPPSAVVKPKRRGLKWRKNLSQSATTPSYEAHLLPINKTKESCSEANLTSKQEHGARCERTGEDNACQAHLNLDYSVRAEDEKGEPNHLTSKLISLFENTVKGEKVSSEMKESSNTVEAHKSKNFAWTAEDEALAYTEVKCLESRFGCQCDEFKECQSLSMDKSTEMDKENENIAFHEFLDQEIQVCCDYHDIESDEWVNEKLRIIQDKIKRRKHRLVYCISSDEDDVDDKQYNKEGTDICFPYTHNSQEKPFEARKYLRSQQLCSYENIPSLPSPTQKQNWVVEESLADGFANGDSILRHMKNETDLGLRNDPSNPNNLLKVEMPSKQECFVSRRTLPGLNRNNYSKDKERDKSIGKNTSTDYAIHDPFFSDGQRGSRPIQLQKPACPPKRQRSPETETLLLRKVSFSNIDDQFPTSLPQQPSDMKEISNTNALLDQDNEISLASDYDQSQEHQKDHCLILDLRCHQDGKATKQSPKNRQKSQSGIHKFYLPQERWSNGCKAMLHVKLSPTNPHKHHVTTTAFDPDNRRSEILFEETVVTNNLKSSFNLQ